VPVEPKRGIKLGGERVLTPIAAVVLTAVVMLAGCAKQEPTVSGPTEEADQEVIKKALLLYMEHKKEAGGAEAVDANGDGIIDHNDFLLLVKKANACYVERIRPLIDKAGIEFEKDREGNVIARDAADKLKTNLTPVEQKKLKKAVNEWNTLCAQVSATLVKGMEEAARKER
jgi:hypothetical protein